MTTEQKAMLTAKFKIAVFEKNIATIDSIIISIKNKSILLDVIQVGYKHAIAYSAQSDTYKPIASYLKIYSISYSRSLDILSQIRYNIA